MQVIPVASFWLVIGLVILVVVALALRWLILPARQEPRLSIRATLFDLLGLAALPFTGHAVFFAFMPDSGGGSGLAWIGILTAATGGLFGLALVVSLGFSIRLVLRVPTLISRRG